MEKKKCPHCGKEFSKMGIGTHIWRMHGKGKNFNSNTGYVKGTRVAWNKGLTKEQFPQLAMSEENKKKLSDKYKGQKLSEDHKHKVSEGMKKAHAEGRAWNIGKSRWNSESSYPEKFFMLVIENEFDDKDYQKELSIGHYSADFAWVDKKKVIEIDGDQHCRNDAQLHDKKRDEFFKEQGWEVLRIRWKDMFKDTKTYLKIAYNFIH